MLAFVRSLLFALFLGAITPVFALLSLAVSSRPPLARYRIIAHWSRAVTFAAEKICGVRWKLEGQLPAAPCVICSRHESAWEAIAFQALLPPQCFVLKKELLRIPFFGWGLARMSPIAIDRAAKISALAQMRRQGRARLAAGFHIVVFPEGTRMQPGVMTDRHHSGGAWLAREVGAPVAPVALNSGKCWGKNAFIKKPGLITVRIGPPIDAANRPPREVAEEARQWMAAQTDIIAPPPENDGGV